MNSVAITGIDGCGKSTIIKRMNSEYANMPTIGFIACPSYHHIPGTGVDELSILFERLNILGDLLKINDLKALALYLQMSLYATALKTVSNRPLRSIVIAERHPLIDTIVYGSLYIKQIQGFIDQSALQPVIEKELNAIYPNAFREVLNWIDYLNARMGRDLTFWNYTGFLKDTFANPSTDIIHKLSGYFNLELPDRIILLEIEPHIAIERLKHRNKQLELHETEDWLKFLQDKFLKLLDTIHHLLPRTEISVVKNCHYEEVLKSLHLNLTDLANTSL